jgi:NAD(P)-dependent dehydrogenase (short-subunit alcohol dehydrogenase family)
MRTFKGRTAVITGAGSGIGRGTALALAARGVNVVAAEISADRAAETVAAVEKAGAEAIAVACDVAAAGALENVRQRALEAFGRIDILMNNVGVVYSGPFLEVGMDLWRRSFEINLFAQIRAVQLMLNDMLKNGEGHVVNVASTTALYPYNVDRMSYNSAKAAILSFSEALTMDVTPKGVGVTCLCPGPVKTNIREQMHFIGENRTVSTPGLPSKEAEEVGVMVADAIRDGVFFLPTNEEVHAIFARRGADPDAFLKEATAKLGVNTSTPT